MRRKCSSKFFCIKNTTLIFLIIISLLTIYIIHNYLKTNNTIIPKIHNHINMNNPFQNSVLSNPHRPPLKTNDYINAIPINVKTQGNNNQFTQIGILNRENGKDTILPLMGKLLINNRSKWQYYTITNDNNVKLPIIYKGKSSMNEYGCDEVYNGDTVYVKGYNDTFKITIYENNNMQYIPY